MENREEELREKIWKTLDSIISKIQNQSSFRRFIFMLLKAVGVKEFKLTHILDKAIDYTKDLEKQTENQLIELHKEVIFLELRYKKIVMLPNIISGIFYLLIGIGVLVALWFLRDWDKSDLAEYEPYVIGVSGTILYYMIKIVQSDKNMDKVKRLFARVSTTVVVCFILIVILNYANQNQAINDDNQIFNNENQKVLLYFTCGYSIEVIIEFLNKLIEKANAIIRAF